MSLADRLLAIHIDATTRATPIRRKRRPRIASTIALVTAALLMLALAAWR